MPGFHKRREYKYEGTVESIYLIDDMTVEVVADGIHVPPLSSVSFIRSKARSGLA